MGGVPANPRDCSIGGETMILSNVDILKAIDQKKIIIDPLDRTNLRAASIEVKLGDCIQVYESSLEIVDSKMKSSGEQMKSIRLEPNQFFILNPDRFALAVTREWIDLSNDLTGRLDGISGIGRLGIAVHLNEGYISPGFSGKITFSIKNLNNLPIKIYSGMNICQIAFTKLTSQFSSHELRNEDMRFMSSKNMNEDFVKSCSEGKLAC